MRFFDRRALQRREGRRRRAAEKRRDVPLREFVYLDEISVYSLLTSRLGPIATEFTATESSTLTSALHASVGFSAGAKAEAGSRIETAGTSESQVIRKSIVQTTFRELLDYEREALIVGRSTTAKAPTLKLDELKKALNDPAYSQWIVSPMSLKRGELLELTIELETEPIFRVNAAMAAVLDVFETNRGMATASRAELSEAIAAKHALDHLLAGLVPLRGRCVDWVHVTIDGESRLINKALFESLSDAPGVDASPLFVVGVAEAALFWKDIRRVVFSGSRYQVLCRVGRDGVHSKWSPIKLADVLRSVAPEVARQFDDAGEGLLAAMAAAVESADEQPSTLQSAPLTEYAAELATRYGGSANAAAKAISSLTIAELQTADASTIEARAVFGRVADALSTELGIQIDPEVAADVRADIVTRDFAASPTLPTSVERTVEPDTPEPRYIDSEIVAIYW
jgi:hypothetical protein